MSPSHKEATSIAALIINWNGSADTIELLQSLDSIKGFSISAFVVDNASAASDLRRLSEFVVSGGARLPIRVIGNAVNVGVPAGYNQAIQMAGCDFDYYLRLDNDVVVFEDGIRAMIGGLEKRRSEGFRVVGGNIRYYDNPNESNGGAVSIDLLAGRTSVDYPNEDIVCDGVLGCIMLLDRDVVRRFSPTVFDSSLFLCTDESELSLRLREQAWRTLYVAKTIGLHKSGRSTNQVRPTANYFSARNWTILRLRYARVTTHRLLVYASIAWSVFKSIIRLRVDYPLGALAGILIYWAERLDLRRCPVPRGDRSA